MRPPLDKSVNRKKFLIQIIVAIAISLCFQFVIAPFIVDPIMAFVTGEPQDSSRIIITLSQWFFSFSVVFFLDPHNKLINNYLFCGFLPVTFFLLYKFIFLQVFVDFLHVLPILVNIIILWKIRNSINLKLISICSLFLAIWLAADRLLELAYIEFPIVPIGVMIIILWPLFNIGIAYFIKFLQGRKLNPNPLSSSKKINGS